VFGYVNITRHFYAAMKRRGQGVIVNVIGLAGHRPDPGYIAGSAGNAALIAFTRALGKESVNFGIRVVGVNPALTDTERAQTLLHKRAEGAEDEAAFIENFLSGLPMGRIDYAGTVNTACLAYVPEAQVGHYVLVHAGFALNVLDEEEAQKRLALWDEMVQAAAAEGTDIFGMPLDDLPGGVKRET